MWGANVLIYNADKIKQHLDSWDVLYDPKYKGKITVPDNPIQIADPALQFFGAKNPYAIDQATLDKVKAKLKQQRRWCASTGCWRPTSSSCSSRATRRSAPAGR